MEQLEAVRRDFREWWDAEWPKLKNMGFTELDKQKAEIAAWSAWKQPKIAAEYEKLTSGSER